MLIIFGLVGFALVAFGNIFAKAGYPRILALALLVPGINFVVVLWFAFARWPVIEELRRLRSGAAPGA